MVSYTGGLGDPASTRFSWKLREVEVGDIGKKGVDDRAEFQSVSVALHCVRHHKADREVVAVVVGPLRIPRDLPLRLWQ